MPEILLVAINAKWIHPSLALRLLKANLGILESRCEILEFALRQPLDEKLAPVIAASPRVLGLSVSIWNHKATLELLKALAAGRSSSFPVIVLGGPEVSFLKEDAELFRYADYVIRGEGETVFRELCGTLLGETPAAGNAAPGCVPGEKIPHFIAAPREDLAALKPAYHVYSGEDLQRKLVYVESSRDCPFGCEFCLSAASPSAPREFPLEPFLAEMDELIGRGARGFKFLDRTFNLNIKRAVRILDFFLERIEKNTGTEKALWVHFEMAPGIFPPELRNVLRRFPPGSLRLEIGIQTLNNETAARIHRACGSVGAAGAALETIAFLRNETSAIVHADLIAGLPGENLISLGEGFDRLWAVMSGAAAGPVSFEIQLGILKLLPGAPIARHTEPFGMIYSTEPPYEVLETAALPARDLERVKNFARFWERIVNSGAFPDSAHRLFPAGKPVFAAFMELSDRLLKRFGRNWGIDRKELRNALEEQSGGPLYYK
jgi:radical SAM superfamily enzyme YgiQ (UPF0313 family)